MLDVFLHAGFEVHLDKVADREVGVHLDLRGNRPLAAAVAERERRAVTASITPLLAPESVVVIGASRGQGGAGRAVMHNLKAKNGHQPADRGPGRGNRPGREGANRRTGRTGPTPGPGVRRLPASAGLSAHERRGPDRLPELGEGEAVIVRAHRLEIEP
jgi:hypothetical protein